MAWVISLWSTVDEILVNTYFLLWRWCKFLVFLGCSASIEDFWSNLLSEWLGQTSFKCTASAIRCTMLVVVQKLVDRIGGWLTLEIYLSYFYLVSLMLWQFLGEVNFVWPVRASYAICYAICGRSLNQFCVGWFEWDVKVDCHS